MEEEPDMPLLLYMAVVVLYGYCFLGFRIFELLHH